jgi:hypothetical protein
MDAFKGFLRTIPPRPETGKNNYLIIQAEDELAAIGMVWAHPGTARAPSRPRLGLDSH